MRDFIGKEVKDTTKSDKLDDGILILFTDGTSIEVTFNENEGYIIYNKEQK